MVHLQNMMEIENISIIVLQHGNWKILEHICSCIVWQSGRYRSDESYFFTNKTDQKACAIHYID